MQGSDLEDNVRKEKPCRFWPGTIRDYVFLGAFLATVIVGGNAILQSARPEFETEVTVEAKKKNKREFYERWLYHSSKNAGELYEQFFGEGRSAPPVEKKDGYISKD